MIGGVPALCNPSYKPSELNVQLRMIKARAILASKVSLENCLKAVDLSVDSKEKGGEFKTLDSKPPVWLFEGKANSEAAESLADGSAIKEDKEKGIEKLVKGVKGLLSKKKGDESSQQNSSEEAESLTLLTLIETGKKEGEEGIKRVEEADRKTVPREDTGEWEKVPLCVSRISLTFFSFFKNL